MLHQYLTRYFAGFGLGLSLLLGSTALALAPPLRHPAHSGLATQLVQYTSSNPAAELAARPGAGASELPAAAAEASLPAPAPAANPASAIRRSWGTIKMMFR